MSMQRPWYTHLYVQVLIAIGLGIAVGHYYPETGKALKPLGDAFVALIRMMIAPVIFCTIVGGIAQMSDMKKVGRIGIKALVYFEVVSTLALLTGLLIGYLLHPGSGFNVDPASLDPKVVARFVTQAKEVGIVPWLLGIIPDSYLSAFSSGAILQVLLISVVSGIAIVRMGAVGQRVAGAVATGGRFFFAIIRIIVMAAPIGAFGAMAFTVGQYGVGSLWNLAGLIGTFYVTALLFVLVILGTIARLAGFSILRFIAYIKDELLIVLGTSSSETVMPQMMEKLERLGPSRSVVGLVFPTGYSFNTDGTNIYMTLSVLFLAQATNTDLSLVQIGTVLLVAMVLSKGGSGVTGNGFVTLAATLAIVPNVPIQALALILGIDKFMSECRALTNVVGNGVATLVVSRWEHEIDDVRLRDALSKPVPLGDVKVAKVA
jgi:aerobic C4-dicarboxylate transport protein